jgi:hypothetical protein
MTPKPPIYQNPLLAILRGGKQAVQPPVQFGIPQTTTPQFNLPTQTAQTTRQASVAPAPIQPTQPTAPRFNFSGGDTISQGTVDPRILQGEEFRRSAEAKLGSLSKVLFGTGKQAIGKELYEQGSVRQSIVEQGLPGWLAEMVRSRFNPTREQVGEKVFKYSQTLEKKGWSKEDALREAMGVMRERVDNEATQRLGSVTASPEARRALRLSLLGEDILAGLELTPVGGATKPVGKLAGKAKWQKMATDMTEEDAVILRNYVAEIKPGSNAKQMESTVRLAQELGIEPLPWAEQKRAISELLEAYDERWGGVREALNPPVQPNRPGAMDIRRVDTPRVEAPKTPAEAKASGMSFDEWLKGQGETVYHGTSKGNIFDKFDTGKAGLGNANNINHQGDVIYLTNSKEAADYFSTQATRNAKLRNRNLSLEEATSGADEIGEVMQINLAKGAKVKDLDYRPTKAQVDKLRQEGWDAISFPEEAFNAKDLAGTKVSGLQSRTIAVLDNTKVKTRAQLKAEWDAATPNKKLQAFREGRPSPQGGYIRNPLAGTPARKGVDNQAVSSAKNNLDELRLQRDFLQESIESNPARQLQKFFKGDNTLAEVQKRAETTGGKSRRLDDIVNELGYRDLDEAQKALEAYRNDKVRLADLNATIRDTKVTAKGQATRSLVADNKLRIREKDGQNVYEYKKGNEWVAAKSEAEAIRKATPNPTFTTKVDSEIASLDALAQQSVPPAFRIPPPNPVTTNPSSVPERIIVHMTDRNQVSAIKQRGSNEIASYKNAKGETKYGIRNTGIYAPKEVENVKDIRKGLLGGQSYNLRDAFFEADGKTLQDMATGGSGPLAKIWSRSIDTLNLRNEFVSNNAKMTQQLSQKHRVPLNNQTGKQMFDALEGKPAPANIKAMAEDVRKVLDAMREEANVVRKAMGREEIGFVKDYAPHLQSTNFWAKMRADARTTISDNFDYILPNVKRNPHAIPRKGGMDNLETDFWKLFDSYSNSMADDIFTTQTIEQLKAVNAVVKGNNLHNLSRVIEDTIRTGYVGKPAQLDAMLGFKAGSKRRMVVGAINQARNISALAGNLVWTFIVQPASLMGMTLPRGGIKAFTQGTLDWVTNPAVRKEVQSLNTFKLKTKSSLGKSQAGDIESLSESVRKTKIDSFNSYATWISDLMEYNLSGVSAATGFRKAKNLGLKPEDQRLFASYMVEATQSAYNKEARPRLLQNLTVRAAAPFQTFAFELYRYTKTLAGKGGGLPLAKKDRLIQFTTLMTGMFLYDQYSRNTTGRQLFSIAPFVPVVGPVAETQVDKGLVALGLKKRTYTGGGRSPVAPLADIDSLIKAGDDFINKGNITGLRKELIKWGMGGAGIGGASTVNRFVDGMIASSQGYQKTRSGEVAFFLEGTDRLTAPIIGPYSTKAGQEYGQQFDSPSVLSQLTRSREERELEKTRQAELKERREISNRVDIIINELEKLPPEQANARLVEIAREDVDLAKRIRAAVKEERRFDGLDKKTIEEYQAIQRLGVTNGKRAEYVYRRASKMEPAEANAFIKELAERGVISKNVIDQIRELRARERGIIEQ